jgi:UDP:flavonoid glycosyltransferase YjiC (YdhE family)
MGRPRVTIITLGNRGHVQPFIAIALALKSNNYAVRILSSEEHEDFVSSFDIEFVSVWGTDLIKQLRTGNKFLSDIQDVKSSMIRNAKGYVNSVLNDFEEHKPNIILAGPFSEYFEYYARYNFGIPTIHVRLSLLCFGQNWYYNGVQSAVYDCFRFYDNEIGEPQKRVCGKISRDQFISESQQIVNGKVNGKSSRIIVVCQPAFYYKTVTVNLGGPCVVNVEQERLYDKYFGGPETRAQIDEFIAKEPDTKPIYCGWGSTHEVSPQTLDKVVKALTMLDQRGIILVPNLSSSYVKTKFLFLPQAPHEYIFPKVKCIVHHGGNGTSLAALRAGVPSVIMSESKNGQCYEHYQQSQIVHGFRCGSILKEGIESFDPCKLADAIWSVNHDKDILEQCKKISQELKGIDGRSHLMNMVDIFMTMKSPKKKQSEDCKSVRENHNEAELQQNEDDDELTEAESLPDHIQLEDNEKVQENEGEATR